MLGGGALRKAPAAPILPQLAGFLGTEPERGTAPRESDRCGAAPLEPARCAARGFTSLGFCGGFGAAPAAATDLDDELVRLCAPPG
mmetsp:Transcript_43173/g.123442  ORF Transcript_43173/g.123442 Transcript_43173/m.123442 type:complete len:86 (-) Transcript_43173:493-750(-)